MTALLPAAPARTNRRPLQGLLTATGASVAANAGAPQEHCRGHRIGGQRHLGPARSCSPTAVSTAFRSRSRVPK
jgi:hypothetical protein